MLERHFGAPKTLRRLRAGFSGPHVDAFADALDNQGYAHASVIRYVRAAAHLGVFVKRRARTLADIDDRMLEAFVQHLRRCRCPESNGGKTGYHASFGVKLFYLYLIQCGVCPDQPTTANRSVEPALVTDFREWFQIHRGVLPPTLRHYTRGATELLNALGEDVSRWDPQALRAFLMKRAGECGTETTQKLITSLRAFLRYLSFRGDTRDDLHLAIPAVAHWRLAALPRTLSAAELDRLIAACGGNTQGRLRDRAIILLLSRLGLRAGDVARIQFADIDWKGGTLQVMGKGRYQVRLPLPQEVGDALLQYVECRSLVSDGDHVFLRTIAPVRSLTAHGISAVVKHALRRAGVEAPAKGAHLLRHYAGFRTIPGALGFGPIGGSLTNILPAWSGGVFLTFWSGRRTLMNQVFRAHRLCKQDSPLGPYIDSYAAEMRGEGYAQQTSEVQIRLIADFGHWLAKRRMQAQEITAELFQTYLHARARRRRPTRNDLPALRRLLDLLVRLGVASEPILPAATPTERLQSEFRLYLQQERALALTTQAHYLAFLSEFLTERFGAGPVDLAGLCAADVTGFVRRRAVTIQSKRVQLMTTALRSFLRFARYRGDIDKDLAACVPTVANWKLSTIPRALPPAQVERVLASIDRKTAMGRRDYAILLILARLGLRAGEIRMLTLEDLDWQEGLITVHGKAGRYSQLPLPSDVGAAIADYLRHGRPTASSRCVFLRAKAPAGGFQGQSGVGSMVRHALARAGIDASRKGAHQFRHALACQMLRQGASLSEIGELLRHRSPQTTAIYAKVDMASLATLALPWPGGAQ